MESVVVTMQDMRLLEEVERLRAEFLSMVSHELRMPLTSIRGSVMAMLDNTEGLDPAETRQFLRLILDLGSTLSVKGGCHTPSYRFQASPGQPRRGLHIACTLTSGPARYR